MPTGPEILQALPIIAILIVIEGLLSVDNALAIASMASHLPGRQKFLALRLGIIGAYAFRGVALWAAAWIIQNPWLKLAGALYLVYLMCAELTKHETAEDRVTARQNRPGFWFTVVQIEAMDLSLSIDNVVAAVALAPTDPKTGEEQMWVVYTGVFIGILALRLVAGFCIRLIAKFPILGATAFLLVGFVGVLLVYELLSHHDVGSLGKLVGVTAIIAVSLLYERRPGVKAALQPVVGAAHHPMRWFASAVELIFSPVIRLAGLLRKKRVPTPSAQ